MAHQELVEYISTAINGGVSEPQIVQTLTGVGWAMTDIEEALGIVKGTKKNTDSSFQSVIQQAKQEEKTAASPTATELQSSLQRNQPLPVIATPATPVSMKDTSTPTAGGSRRPMLIKIFVFVVVLLGAGTGIAYYKGYIGFGTKPTYTKGSILLSASEAISSMDSAKYNISLHIASEPYDETLKAFTPTPLTEQEMAPYKRDQDRFTFLKSIRDAFPKPYGTTKIKNIFPKNLADIGLTAKDPSGSPYAYTQKDGGKDFELRITFETPEALTAFQNSSGNKRTAATSPESSREKDNTVIVDSKNYTEYYYFSGYPDTFTFVDAFANSDDVVSWLPGSLDITLGMSGIMNKKSSDVRDTYLQGTADVDLGDFTANADIEFIKKNDAYFVRINKMPTFFFFDFSAIKKQWVQIETGSEAIGLVNPQTIQTSLADEFSFFGLSPSAGKKNVPAKEGALLMLSVGEKSGFIDVGEPTSETRNGEAALRYPIRFEKTKLKTFYTEIIKEAERQFGTDSPLHYNEQIARELEYKNVGELIDYLNDSSAISMWVSQKTGYPIAFEYTIHIAPKSTTGSAMKKQFQIRVAIALSDINKSNTIDAPQNALSTEDAVILMSGISKEAYRFGQQTSAIDSIKSALSTYHSLTGSYPTTLTELQKTREEIKKLHPNASQKPAMDTLDSYYVNRKLLEKIPVDIYTKKAFSYTKNGDDYTLTYTITLPPYERGMQVTYSLMQNDYSKKTIALAYVSGINTATKNSNSREAISANSQDTDKDGVSDAFETYIGADKNKKDTDNDGVDDRSEINNRSNPLGPGLLEYPKSQGGGLFF